MSSRTSKSAQGGYEMLAISNDERSIASRDESIAPVRKPFLERSGLHTAPLLRSSILRADKRTWIWIFASHAVVGAIMIAVIVLGAIGQTYHFNDSAAFLFFRLSIDNQMFFFGIFSKAADYVLNDSIARITGVLLTVWMSQPTRFPGVIPLDFELSDEMAKPWVAIWHTILRWRLDPPKNKPAAIARVILSLASGFAVLLLGGSINVLAMPKIRWAPGQSITNSINQGVSMEVNTTRIGNINWAHLDAAYSDKFPTNIGDTLVAVSVLQALSNVDNMYIGVDGLVGPQEYVFFSTIPKGIPAQFDAKFESPVLAVRGRGFTMGRPNAMEDVRTISIQEGPIYDFWTADSTSDYGSKAIGARNWVNFTLPMLSTQCIQEISSDTAFSINVPTTAPSQFVARIPGQNSSAALTCTVSFSQMIHPIYIYNSTTDARNEVNVPAIGLQGVNLTGLPFDEANGAIVRTLVSKMGVTIPQIELLSGETFSALAQVLASRVSSSQNLSYPVAMSYVLGLTAQHLITIASWSESPSDLKHYVGPIQWQLYGSGPRLEWQWIIAVVVGITFVILIYDSYLLIVRRIRPGPWLNIPGMMIAANSAESMRGPNDNEEEWRLGVLASNMKRKKIFMRTDKNGSSSLVLEDSGLAWRGNTSAGT